MESLSIWQNLIYAIQDKAMNTWKIGTKWGNRGVSVLETFINYGCAFIGDADDPKVGDWQLAEKGDLLLVCDGETPVAIGEMLSKFERCDTNKMNTLFYLADENNFLRCNTCLCRVRYIMLPAEDQKRDIWRNDPQKRFCRCNIKSEEIKQKWIDLNKNDDNGHFSIDSDIYSLSPVQSEPKIKALFLSNIHFRIPVYQRPYSWGENELRRLFEEMKEALSSGEPVFMGTLQFSERIPLHPTNTEVCAYEIIDGQQRITTFLLLWEYLNKKMGNNQVTHLRHNFISYVNIGSALKDINEFWTWWEMKGQINEDTPNPYIRNMCIIDRMYNEYFQSTDEDSYFSDECVSNFIKTKLRFVVIETRASLSKTLKIFDTINTAGLDLDVSDRFKIQLYEYLKGRNNQDEMLFNEIAKVYESIDDRNRVARSEGGWEYDMKLVMRIYRYILVAKHGLPYFMYAGSPETFFERLFDKLLGDRIWKGYENIDVQLSVDHLRNIIDSLNAWAKEYDRNAELRIIDKLIRATGYTDVWMYTVIALYFGSISTAEIQEFHELILKLLVPAAVYKSKTVYAGLNFAHKLLGQLQISQKGIEIIKDHIRQGGIIIEGKPAQLQIEEACNNHPIATKPKWKRILCCLIEYRQWKEASRGNGNEVCSSQYLFRKMFCEWTEIEHIQSYTDENDAEGTWNKWGEEINRLGNLVILEGDKNRRIKNNSSKKLGEYETSVFESVRDVKKRMNNNMNTWDMDAALVRKADLYELLSKYLMLQSS